MLRKENKAMLEDYQKDEIARKINETVKQSDSGRLPTANTVLRIKGPKLGDTKTVTITPGGRVTIKEGF